MFEDIISCFEMLECDTTKDRYEKFQIDTDYFGVRICDLHSLCKKYEQNFSQDLVSDFLNYGYFETHFMALHFLDPEIVDEDIIYKLLQKSNFFIYREYCLADFISKTKYSNEVIITLLNSKCDADLATAFSIASRCLRFTNNINFETLQLLNEKVDWLIDCTLTDKYSRTTICSFNFSKHLSVGFEDNIFQKTNSKITMLNYKKNNILYGE